ncbi:MAG: nickel insertion protein, partial [Myxococcota bacterium]
SSQYAQQEARPIDRDALARIVFAESTAIGVRVSEWDRLVLERSKKKLKTPLGVVTIKLIRSPDGALECSPEYDDCKRLARKHGVPLREIVEQVRAQARRELAE